MDGAWLATIEGRLVCAFERAGVSDDSVGDNY